MNDDELAKVDQERRNRARSLAVEAAETWVDQFEGYEGQVVTGYVLAIETTRIGHPPMFSWMTGNGTKPQGESSAENLMHGGSAAVELGPLPAWQVRGLCAEVISQLDGREAYLQAERLRSDE